MNDLLKRIYGRKSEKLDPNQLLMQELVLEADKTQSPDTQELAVVTEQTVRAHTRRNHPGRRSFPNHLQRVEHYLDVNEQQKICKQTGKPLKHIGNDITERIDYKQSSLYVNKYIRPKYACSDSQCDDCGIKQHEPPQGPIDRCEADSGMLAHIIEEKYEHHNPLYRQELRFNRHGVEISRKTMAGWMARCAEALRPLYDYMYRDMLSNDIVMNDDTPVNMLEPGLGKTRTTRFWCTIGGKDLKYTMYNFTLSRGRDGPTEFFKDYKGYFVSDAYGGYNELLKSKDIIYVACWAHARRYFVKAQDTNPKAATEILMLISRLYKVEPKIKNIDPESRLKVRQKKSVLILKEIHAWLKDNLAKHLPQSPMRKAIEYTLSIWEGLNVYVTDGRLPIDNNLAENGIRPIALSRKNWMHVGSENGGHTAAILMTFCTTCRKLKINTWEYLKDVLQRINDHPMPRIEELLPDRWQELRTAKK